MKILFIESYPHVIHGQQRTLLSLLEEGVSRKHDCLVGVTSDGVYVDELRRREHAVLTLPYPEKLSSYGGAIYRYKGIDKLKCYGQGVRYLWDLRKTLKAEKPDVVFCNDMRGLLTVGIAARSAGIPVMIWDKLDKPHGWLDWIQLPIASCNPIITTSVLAKYPEWQRKWYSKKIHRVPNGVDLAKADTGNDIRSSLPMEEGDVVIAIVGTITERKGQDRLLKVVPDILEKEPQVRVFIVGEVSGSEEDNSYFDSLSNKEHDRVHFLGMRGDMPDVMRSIDVLVIPSRHEGMGQVTVEAMAASKPLIGARAGGIPEVIVDGETGLLFEGNDSEQLVDCVVKLVSDETMRQRMGESGRHRAEECFNRPLQMQKIVNLIESLAK